MGYRFALDYYDAEGRRVGIVPVDPDWQPAREWAWFEGMRRGQLPPRTLHPPGVVEPVWHDELGAPICSCVRVLVPGAEGPVSADIPRSFFGGLAERAAATLVERGDLREGQTFRYHLLAYPMAEAADAADDAALRVEPAEVALALHEVALDALAARAEPTDDDDDPSDARVFVPRDVIGETLGLARASGELETGGVLVGVLHRDAGSPEIFLEVTAQIPARHARPGAAHFEFTPETWAAADAALRLRGRDEMLLGWWHFHPFFCRRCPEERRRICAFSRPFFSAADVHLHRACFPQAWQVALLVSDLPEEGLCSSLFGWRRGMVVPRGFDVLD